MAHWKILSTLTQTHRYALFRALDSDTGEHFLAKSPIQPNLTQAGVEQFFGEFDFLKLLTGVQGVLLPHSKFQLDHRPTLLYKEDLELHPIQTSVKNPIGVSQFYSLAKSLTQALGAIHQNGVLHKDLQPAHLLRSTDFKEVRITDFSLASTVPRELHQLAPISSLSGTLAYLPPEQSGRVGRSVDYRADFYSLGISLFEILTGKLPFEAQDPIELLYLHLTTPMPDACQLRADIPESLSQIIRKLAAKDPNSRYQGSQGILDDLHESEAIWTSGQPRSFIAGCTDSSEQLNIPEKLYGRETEIKTLLSIAAYGKAREKDVSLTLLCGPAGSGKTALVRSLIPTLIEKHGIVLEGKIDQLNRGSILGVFQSPLTKFMDQLAGDSIEAVAALRSELILKLQSKITILNEIFPSLQSYLGSFAKLQPMAPREYAEVAIQSISTLFEIIGKSNTAVFFLDDLQWADALTFDLLKSICLQPLPGITLIGSFRDNEVAAGHPLRLLEAALGSRTKRVTLHPLECSSIEKLLQDILGQQDYIPQAAQVLFNKTAGSPFYIHQLLRELQAKGSIYLDPKKRIWTLKLHDLEKMNVSSNVVTFLINKFQEFPQIAQDLLATAAAVGVSFELRTVAQVLKSSPSALLPTLDFFVREEILTRLSEPLGYHGASRGENWRFRFLHDRLQQASYELKSEKDREDIHFYLALEALKEDGKNPLKAGGHFLKSNPLRQIGEKKADPLITCQTLLEGSLQTRETTNFQDSLRLAQEGLKIADDSSTLNLAVIDRKRGKEIRQKLLRVLTEVTTDLSLPKESLDYGTQYLTTSDSDIDRADACALLVARAFAFGDTQQGFRYGLLGMKYLDFDIPLKPSKAKLKSEQNKTFRLLSELKRKPGGLKSILKLPPCTDPRVLIFLRVRPLLARVAYFYRNYGCCELLAYMGIRLVIKSGLEMRSAQNIASFLLILSASGRYQLSKELGDVALQLIQHPISTARSSKVEAEHLWSAYVSHLHLEGADWTAQKTRAFQLGCETKNPVALMSGGLALAGLFQYNPVDRTDLYESFQKRVQDIGQPQARLLIASFVELTKLISSKTAEELGQREIDFKARFSECAKNRIFSAQTAYGINWQIYSYLLGGSSELSIKFSSLYRNASATKGTYFQVLLDVFYALTLLRSSSAPQKELIQRILCRLKKLKNFNAFNFEHLYYLLSAESSRRLQTDRSPSQKILSLYYQAIESARKTGNFLFHGLSCERAGSYCLGSKQPEQARILLENALKIFHVWGAWAKVAQLKTTYPEFLTPKGLGMSQAISQAMSPRGEAEISTATLDYEEILKAARTLSAETDLDQLVQKLLEAVAKLSGAERGVLLLNETSKPHSSNGHAHTLQVHSHFDLQGIHKSSDTIFPKSLIERAALRQTALLSTELDALAIQKDFKGSPPKSFACLPCVNQGRVVSLLYLENNSITEAFTQKHLIPLDILTAQASISIANARLYKTLEAQVLEKTENIQSVFLNIKQGIFMLQRGLVLHPEYSKHLEELFGSSDLAHRNPLPLLFNHPSLTESFRSEVKMTLEVALDGDLTSFEMNSHLLPREVLRVDPSGKDQHLEVEWTPLLTSNQELQRILVSIRNVTELKLLQKEAGQQRIELKMIGELLACGATSSERLLKGAETYLVEVRNLLDRGHSSEDLQVIFRNYHTIKGNLRTLGFNQGVDTLHKAETGLKNPHWPALETDYLEVKKTVETYQGLKDKLRKFVEHSEANADSLTLEQILQPTLEGLKPMAQSLGKPPPQVTIVASHRVRSDSASLLIDILGHCLRNSLDHGIEAPTIRLKAGKPAPGFIAVELRGPLVEGGPAQLTLEDDGQGLNLAKLQEKAAEAGIFPMDTSDEKIGQLIFAAGISTAPQLSDLSGRGVGMDAVAAFVKKAGGQVRISFTGPRQNHFRPFQLLFDLPSSWLADATQEHAQKQLLEAA